MRLVVSPVPVLDRDRLTAAVSPGSMAPLPPPQFSDASDDPAATTLGTGVSRPL